MSESLPLNELTSFTRNEQTLKNSVGLNDASMNNKLLRPGESTIRNIMNFSKAYSSRRSSVLDRIEMVLN